MQMILSYIFFSDFVSKKKKLQLDECLAASLLSILFMEHTILCLPCDYHQLDTILCKLISILSSLKKDIHESDFVHSLSMCMIYFLREAVPVEVALVVNHGMVLVAAKTPGAVAGNCGNPGLAATLSVPRNSQVGVVV